MIWKSRPFDVKKIKINCFCAISTDNKTCTRVRAAAGVRGRLRRTRVPDVADRGRAQDRPGQSAVRPERRGPVEREVRGGRRAGGHDRVDGTDHAGAHVVSGVRGALGPPVPSAGQVLQNENGVRSGLFAVPRRVQGGHAVVQRERFGNVFHVQRDESNDDDGVM